MLRTRKRFTALSLGTMEPDASQNTRLTCWMRWMRGDERVVSDVSGRTSASRRIHTHISSLSFALFFFLFSRNGSPKKININPPLGSYTKKTRAKHRARFLCRVFRRVLFPRIALSPLFPGIRRGYVTYVSARVGGLVAAVSSALLGHGDGFGPARVAVRTESKAEEGWK